MLKVCVYFFHEKTGFLVRALVDLLSILSTTFSPSSLSISHINSLIHIACFTASVAAMNSASHDDNDDSTTNRCFCDVQVINDESK